MHVLKRERDRDWMPVSVYFATSGKLGILKHCTHLPRATAPDMQQFFPVSPLSPFVSSSVKERTLPVTRCKFSVIASHCYESSCISIGRAQSLCKNVRVSCPMHFTSTKKSYRCRYNYSIDPIDGNKHKSIGWMDVRNRNELLIIFIGCW